MLVAPVPAVTPTIAERVADYRAYSATRRGSEEIHYRGHWAAFTGHFPGVDSSTLAEIEHEYWRQLNEESLAARQRLMDKYRQPKTPPHCGLCGRAFGSWREAWKHEDDDHRTEQVIFQRAH